MGSNLSEFRTQLWDWLCAALRSNRHAYDHSRERSDLLLLYSRLLELGEAAYLLCKQAGMDVHEGEKKRKRYNHIIYLTREGRKDPLLVFERFFEDFHLNELRNDLWSWLDATLSSNNATYNNYQERDDVLFLYYRLMELGEAGLILTHRAGRKETFKKHTF